MENTYTNERQIDLKAMFFSVLYKWRSIVVCAVALALLLGGYKAVKESGLGVDDTTSAELSEDYERELEDYEAQNISYESSIANIENEISSINEYLENSVLMNIDPYSIPMAKADLYVKAEEETAGTGSFGVDPADSLVGVYEAGIPRGLDWTELKELTGIKQEKYLEELIRAEASIEGNTVTVTVYYEDEKTAEAILDNVLEQVEEKSQDIADSAGAHTVTVMNRAAGTVIDTTVADKQRNFNENLITYNTRLGDRKKAADELTEPSEPDGSSGVSKRDMLKGGIKFAILGGAAGVFLMAFLWVMVYLLSGRIHGEADIKDSLGIDVLGIYDVQTKKRPFAVVDSWIRSLAGHNKSITNEKVIERVVIQLRPVLEKGSKLLITGTVPEEELQELKNQFAKYFREIEITVGSDLNHSVTTLDLLSECDKVLLVEQREKSVYGEVAQEQEMILSLAKPVVGCILF